MTDIPHATLPPAPASNPEPGYKIMAQISCPITIFEILRVNSPSQQAGCSSYYKVVSLFPIP